MKSQFIARLVTQPWNISKTKGRSIVGNIVATLLQNERPAADIFGDPLPAMQILGNIAVIPIRGVMQINVPDWIKAWGFNLTDANDIEEEIDKALADPAVSRIVLDVDSPGGASLAGDKMFDVVERGRKTKPIFGWAGDGADAASSAYEAIAPCNAILTGPYADAVGCVGTYLTMLDDSEYWNKLGITFEVFRSGALKGIGEDALSEEQKAYLQQMADDYGTRFRSNVLKYRTGIKVEDLQGQWFRGDEAAQRGFTAGTAKNLNAAIVKFQQMF